MLPERRMFPRYYLHFPVEVTIDLPDESKTLTVESVNISRAGIQLSGDSELMACFRAQEHYPQTCEIRFRLPDTEETFHIQCQLTTHRRLSQHHFHAVLTFTEFHNNDESRLLDCLREMQPPKPANGMVAAQMRNVGRL